MDKKRTLLTLSAHTKQFPLVGLKHGIDWIHFGWTSASYWTRIKLSIQCRFSLLCLLFVKLLAAENLVSFKNISPPECDCKFFYNVDFYSVALTGLHSVVTNYLELINAFFTTSLSFWLLKTVTWFLVEFCFLSWNYS